MIFCERSWRLLKGVGISAETPQRDETHFQQLKIHSRRQILDRIRPHSNSLKPVRTIPCFAKTGSGGTSAEAGSRVAHRKKAYITK